MHTSDLTNQHSLRSRTAADDNHPGPPETPRTQQTRHECPQTRSERLSPGGPARGSAATRKNWVNLKKDSELELEDLEKERTVSITNLYYYYRGLPLQA